jgi:AraC family transcriptional activator of pobA
LEASLRDMATFVTGPSRGTIAARRLDSGLQPRRMAFDRLLPSSDYAAVLLTGGRASVVSGDDELQLTAPAIGWLPIRHGAALMQAPGSPGYLAGLSEQAIVEATMDSVDAPFLRHMAARAFVIDTAGLTQEIAELSVALDGIERETRDADRGSRTLLAAYVRIIIVGLWRLSGIEPGGAMAVGQARGVLIRFRELVEIHFRDHWRIRDYAAAVGVSHDRLHAVCTRDLARTPLSLVHDRLNFEARQHLTRAALNVQQISHALGFRDPAHFSSFFKRVNGVGPSQFRQAARTDEAGDALDAGGSYADWP